MSIDPNIELAQFKDFIVERLATRPGLSPEEALDLWRAENPRANDYSETVQAIRISLADMDAGDTGVSLDEFDRAFRRGHDLPSTS